MKKIRSVTDIGRTGIGAGLSAVFSACHFRFQIQNGLAGGLRMGMVGYMEWKALLKIMQKNISAASWNVSQSAG